MASSVNDPRQDFDRPRHPEGVGEPEHLHRLTDSDQGQFANTLSMYGGPTRENARSLIERRIAKLEAEAHALRELSKALPLELSPAADQALWNLVFEKNSR